ncbi:DUF2267 domain-containing protein [Dactylosporangium aurantiacum]|uniref:DUF2267 domain-containing protein n=1 Tax=Dactylosporangium aurantiacum TaxID=35754 RepID=A0A9Q9MLA0_9ACTN|nr:DUF2267 domain-containing protein [Dactylosporangium aurantiacum]MDG6104346.1 DUF2267 domain-containing protein [Dactylosporangium aurantiacum]UWZ56666.1 DUF2267 domain-containing protein [Dactylosporangium aurantiacum]
MYEDVFITEVREKTGLATAEETRRALRGVLHALANRLPDGWVHHLAAELPPTLAEPLWSYQHLYDQEVHLDFLADVAARAAVPPALAERLARAVFAAVASACDPALLRRVYAPLTSDILALTESDRSLLPV